MPNLTGRKWGAAPDGTEGGTITWSLVDAGQSLASFIDAGVAAGPSTSPTTTYPYDAEQIIRTAFDAWSTEGNIEFMQIADGGGAAGTGAVADIRIFFGFMPGNFIGYAFFPENINPATSGDILFDSTFLGGEAQFLTLAMHEIGHAIGLDHINGPFVMNPTILTLSALTLDDISGVQQIYGVQDNLTATYALPAGQVELMILDAPDQLMVTGNALGNTIQGTASQETLLGEGGDDILNGGAGIDALFGGDNLDLLQGGAGADTLDGGDFFDFASFADAPGSLTIDLVTPSNSSTFFAEDTLIDIEFLVGAENHSNTFVGDSGNWYFLGGDLADTITGGSAADVFQGGAGNDVIYGGGGSDGIWGITGNDTLYGGLGEQDGFYFLGDNGHDVIKDFEITAGYTDLFIFVSPALNSISDLSFSTDTNGDAMISWASSSVTVEGITQAQIETDASLYVFFT